MIPDFELSYRDIVIKYYFKFMVNCDFFIFIDYLKDNINFLSMKDIYNKFNLHLNYNKVN